MLITVATAPVLYSSTHAGLLSLTFASRGNIFTQMTSLLFRVFSWIVSNFLNETAQLDESTGSDYNARLKY